MPPRHCPQLFSWNAKPERIHRGLFRRCGGHNKGRTKRRKGPHMLGKQKPGVLDRPLERKTGKEVSLSAFAHLFAAIIQQAQASRLPAFADGLSETCLAVAQREG